MGSPRPHKPPHPGFSRVISPWDLAPCAQAGTAVTFLGAEAFPQTVRPLQST